MTPLDAALEYADRGWPVFPMAFNRDPDAKKYPLTTHGMNDATRDAIQLKEWWAWRANAVPAIVTGEASGIVALDIDIRPDGSGFDSLDELGITTHPIAPTAHTPRGGCAVLFKWPRHFVKTCASELAPHLDIRGDRGSVILPPGPGRFWDAHLGKDTPLPEMPEWMRLAEPEPPVIVAEPVPIRGKPLSRYSEAALDGAIKSIVSAPAGQQQQTLNREVYSIARLVAGNVLPAALAIGPRDSCEPMTRVVHGGPPSSIRWSALPSRTGSRGHVNRKVGANDDGARRVRGDKVAAHRVERVRPGPPRPRTGPLL